MHLAPNAIVAITGSVVCAGARGRYFKNVELVTRPEDEVRIGEAKSLVTQFFRLELVVLGELGCLPFARSGAQDQP